MMTLLSRDIFNQKKLFCADRSRANVLMKAPPADGESKSLNDGIFIDRFLLGRIKERKPLVQRWLLLCARECEQICSVL